MGRIASTCLRSLLKFVNSMMGLLGIAMILYGLWMIRVWQRDTDGSPYVDFNSTGPWFIYTFLGIGIILGVITCLGHFAADSVHGCCLSCDLPEDPTGRFRDFEDFVKSNLDIFKWICLLILLAQGFSILLSLVLRTLGPNQKTYFNYDSDEDYAPERLPLINNKVQPPPYVNVIADPRFSSKSDTWNAKK
ncbi:hypothetical protein ACB092_05G121300 [Castanea dentata]